MIRKITGPSPDDTDTGTRSTAPNTPMETATQALADVKPSSPALWMGVYLGAFLDLVMVAALVAANRFPSLDPYALERNAASYGLFVLLLLVPVVWFLKRPVQMFTAGIIGWVIFVAGYDIAGLFFRHLFDVLRTPFEALIEGAVLYGVAAVLSWVVGMILHARRHTIAPRRRPAPNAIHYYR